MKIKEVIAKTGLTDRAIRLYIENDLVKPECDENYNGRKSIDFSERDVEQLKNIALLRKADFSIQEIKDLQIGGEVAQNTIKEYINRTNEKIQFSSEIIEKIGTLADEENITIEIICEKLSSNLENEKVPVEDMELSWEEVEEKRKFIIISVIGMILAVIAQIFIIQMVSLYNFKFTVFWGPDLDFEVRMITFFLEYFFVIQFIYCFTIFILYIRNKRIGRKKDRKKALCIFITILWVLSLLISPFMLLGNAFTSYVSATTNLDNYMEIDRGALPYSMEELYYVFPYEIPYPELDYTGTDGQYRNFTKYHYEFEPGWLYTYSTCLYAEWKLNDESFEKEKERILSKDNIVTTLEIGDWQCVYFERLKNYDDSGLDNYRYLLFAYNDETKMVRYCAEVGGQTDPYHLQLEW